MTQFLKTKKEIENWLKKNAKRKNLIGGDDFTYKIDEALCLHAKTLQLKSNQIEFLPFKLGFIEILILDENNFKVLPKLPEALKILSVSNNQLKFLPLLPQSLICLNIESNEITHLSLPQNLVSLDVSENKLNESFTKEVEKLEALRYFSCNFNSLPLDFKFFPNNTTAIELGGQDLTLNTLTALKKLDLQSLKITYLSKRNKNYTKLNGTHEIKEVLDRLFLIKEKNQLDDNVLKSNVNHQKKIKL